MKSIFDSINLDKIRSIAEEVGLPFENVEKLCSKKMEELKGLISEEGAIFVVGKILGVEIDAKKEEPVAVSDEKTLDVDKYPAIKNMERKDMSIWDDIDLSTNEFLPFLKIKNGIVYHLQLVDAQAKPRPSVDGYGNDQHIWDVKLLDLNPAKAFNDADKEGKANFMKNKIYSFGMKKTAMRRFKDLWEAVKIVDKFSFERTGASFQTDYVFKED